MSQRLFGTDGIRGTAGRFPLDAPTLARLGAALVRSQRTPGREPLIVVGRDTRESGVWIERELTRGAASEGARLESMGVAPTPAVAFVTKDAGFDAGVMISASHNPYLDNGIKIFSHDGVKLTERAEDDLEAQVLDDALHVDGESPWVGRRRPTHRSICPVCPASASGPWATGTAAYRRGLRARRDEHRRTTYLSRVRIRRSHHGVSPKRP